MFDLAQYEISDTAQWTVEDAKGNPIKLPNGDDWTLTLASPGTKKAMRAAHKRQQAKQAEMFGTMAGKTSKRTEDDEARDRANFLMEIYEGTNAEGFTYQGKTGQDAMRAAFLSPKLGHIADGAEKFHNDRGNFYEDASTSSSGTSVTLPG